ncbi:unnamed protein product [Ilex paraguariensis]|uniref:RNA helicase n=1 Tax=Ilex paraguariensis TaxID=185542 RepID=A0ABC8S3V4_9AQUA
MRASWADSVDNAAVSGSYDNNGTGAGASAPTRSSYVPPHLRNWQPAPSYSGPPSGSDRSGYGGPTTEFRGGGSRSDYGRQGYGGGGRGGSGWGSRGGGWGKAREVNPFGNDDIDGDVEHAISEQENSGINFDAYEDIPVETSGNNVPPPVNTFAEIDLGDALNLNIRRCKYVKPTPVQRHTIPISLAGRDLMACAQTGSGKTAAFCFPIISGIMRGNFQQRPRGMRTVFPLALILSPTRELSMQVGL